MSSYCATCILYRLRQQHAIPAFAITSISLPNCIFVHTLFLPIFRPALPHWSFGGGYMHNDSKMLTQLCSDASGVLVASLLHWWSSTCSMYRIGETLQKHAEVLNIGHYRGAVMSWMKQPVQEQWMWRRPESWAHWAEARRAQRLQRKPMATCIGWRGLREEERW